jgi:response regulator of citrate/malate metabolism
MFRRRQKADPRDSLPKGLQPQKLGVIIGLLRQSAASLSADEVAVLAATSRVTARRYLEYLVSIDRAVVEPLYREVGRPINKFRLLE